MPAAVDSLLRFARCDSRCWNQAVCEADDCAAEMSGKSLACTIFPSGRNL